MDLDSLIKQSMAMVGGDSKGDAEGMVTALMAMMAHMFRIVKLEGSGHSNIYIYIYLHIYTYNNILLLMRMFGGGGLL